MSRLHSTYACCTASAASLGVSSGQSPCITRTRAKYLVYAHIAAKQTALAATLLSLTLVTSPAALATLGSSDYISVQERSRQRSPLQQTSSERTALVEAPSSSSSGTRLSIPQQACCKQPYELQLAWQCVMSCVQWD